mmetsp:Transcript_26849/g.30730  ORF Transcript_26849/g.30730 Transcript_26849/m.30730 type:complete len:512 (-) Transcript_26849:33-1568(-)
MYSKRVQEGVFFQLFKKQRTNSPTHKKKLSLYSFFSTNYPIHSKSTKHHSKQLFNSSLQDDEFPSSTYEPKSFFRYELIHQSQKENSLARVGRIHTPNGIIETPNYVPVATNAALKGVDFRTMDAFYNFDSDDNDTSRSVDSTQLVFCNTYHLLLHPGRDMIREAGGLHQFTSRGKYNKGPFITDSGGFQVFSLAYGSVQAERQSNKTDNDDDDNDTNSKKLKNSLKKNRTELKKSNLRPKPHWNTDVLGPDTVKITEEGVTFKSYRDGSSFLLTPENTVDAQKDFGADIIIPLDELPPHHIDSDTLKESVSRSHRWEARSLKTHLQNVKNQAMYAVIHGGLDEALRRESVDFLTSLPFDGYAIGGSLGKTRDDLKKLLDFLMPLFESSEHRKSKPRHLLGIADEESIRYAVKLGVDTMDSCYPTKLGRHGTLLTSKGMVRIKRGAHVRSYGVPIEEGCGCQTCQHYDRAYLNHLFKAKEPLAIMLGTQHNIFYMQRLMQRIRQDIMDNKI